MSEERSQFAQRIDERKFTLSRRGYDKREVRDYLEDLEQAFREVEGHAKRTAQRVGELERDLSKARATERVSVDNAMMAVFDAKDRILERARRRADEIEEEAHAEGGRIKAAALTAATGEGLEGGELAAARAQADEIVAAARREADRLRRDAQSEAREDLEAELDATAAQLRRAHGDTASAREELDDARRRIVELESGTDNELSGDLEQRFAELESHLSAARSDAERLEGELAARDHQVATLQEAVTAAEQALGESKTYVVGIEEELDARTARITNLESELEELRHQAEEASAGLEEAIDLGTQLRAMESALLAGFDHEDQSELVDELKKANAVAVVDTAVVAELQAEVAAGAERLADAQRTITDLEAARSAEASKDEEEVDAIIVAAHEEAEAILTEAEDEADQRAAKVIAKAHEEADQVRQTVATLTAQAEDARSAALRSKLEAEDLVEAQRSMSDARGDIVATAKARASEIEDEATRGAKTSEQQAVATLAKAEEKAQELLSASEERAQHIIIEAEQRAGAIIAEANAAPPAPAETELDDAEDDLAAMLAEAEQEVALSEELRHQRTELEQREQKLAEREAALAAKQAEVAKMRISGLGTPPPVVAPPLVPTDLLAIDMPEDEEDDLDWDDDPAERLSALLEQAAPTAVPATEVDQPVDLDLLSQEHDDEPRPRMAWPTPVRQAEDASGDDGDDGDDEDDDFDGDEGTRESRYRSRSAQLPRLGNQAKSNMTTMANLRKKSRGIND